MQEVATGRDREHQIAQNEVAFRAANESLAARAFNRSERESLDAYPFLCECGARNCTLVVQLPLETYAEIREHPTRFLIHPGHKQLDSETIVDEGEGYEVVEKAGSAGEVARAYWAINLPR
jgi:hypothetical protein